MTAGLLLVAACGSDRGADASATASVATEPVATEPTETSSDPDVAAPATEEPAPEGETTDASTAGTSGDTSPLETLLGIPFSDAEASQEVFNELSREAEVKVAECMLAQGFEYTVASSNMMLFDDGAMSGSQEFAADYGFGIASNPFEESFEAMDFADDPNSKYLDTLSPGEQEAYQIALFGSIPEPGSEDEAAMAEGMFEPGGCQGEAFDEVFSVFNVFENFADEFDAIEAAYNADPRIVKATTGWSACMTETGFRFTDEDAARAEIQRRYDAIVGQSGSFLTDDELMEQMGEPDGDGTQAMVFGAQTLAPEAQKLVDELAVDERALASASWTCSSDLREIEADIRFEYEQRFVDQHGAAVSAAMST